MTENFPLIVRDEITTVCSWSQGKAIFTQEFVLTWDDLAVS